MAERGETLNGSRGGGGGKEWDGGRGGASTEAHAPSSGAFWCAGARGGDARQHTHKEKKTRQETRKTRELVTRDTELGAVRSSAVYVKKIVRDGERGGREGGREGDGGCVVKQRRSTTARCLRSSTAALGQWQTDKGGGTAQNKVGHETGHDLGTQAFEGKRGVKRSESGEGETAETGRRTHRNTQERKDQRWANRR